MTDPTNQAVRDRLAGMMGWEYKLCIDPAVEGSMRAWTDGKAILFYGHHPIPNTLDSAAACLPPKWRWFREPYRIGNVIWVACTESKTVRVPDTGDEKADRFALAEAAKGARE